MNIDLDEIRPLLMGLMDGELTPEEAARVHEALTRSATLREEYEALRQTTGRLESISFLEPTDEVAQKIWQSPYHRFARDTGIWMIVGGYVLLLSFAFFTFITEDEAPILPRFATAAIVVGTLMLLATFIRERVRTHAVDPYKEVER